VNDKRNILITGTSRGIGNALALHFLGLGDTVIGCSRSDGSIEHKNYHHFQADISDADSIQDLFFQVRKQVKHLDILINNAGIAKMNAFALTPPDSLRQIMDINVNGTFLCSQRAMGLLRKSKNPRIINMTTVAVPFQLEGEAAYAASKSAVETLTRIMAKELAGFNITCNAIGPSPIQTDLIRGVSKEKIAELVQKQSVKKMARVEDVVHLVDFLVHPDSSMITGQIIYLGGVS
jgi:3-oxoacyl-[acyl-carrier protein] reductase